MKQIILISTCLLGLCLPSLAKVEITENLNSVGQCDRESIKSSSKHTFGKSRYEYKAEKAAAKASIETACFQTCAALATNSAKDAAREASACVVTCGQYLEKRTDSGLHW
jgi:hypothetical protein